MCLGKGLDSLSYTNSSPPLCTQLTCEEGRELPPWPAVQEPQQQPPNTGSNGGIRGILCTARRVQARLPFTTTSEHISIFELFN